MAMIGKTKKEAEELWADGNDVICPICERHVDEIDADTFNGEIMHWQCAQEEIRIQQCIAGDEWMFGQGD